MMSPNQISELSKKFRISESVVLREFVQISFLNELYSNNFSKDIFFKGGTAIRLLYQGKRFSEDLDFTVTCNENIFARNINKLFRVLEAAYKFSFKEKDALSGKTYLLTAENKINNSKSFVKLDFSFREPVFKPAKNILKTEYPVIIQNFINCIEKDEILAEKIRAILTRDKHRDLYDLWFLIDTGANFDLSLVNSKLKYYNDNFDKKEFLNSLNKFSKKDFVLDLRPFVPINERNKLEDFYDYIKDYLLKFFSSVG